MTRRANQFLQERFSAAIDNPSTAATLALKFLKVPAGKTLVIDSVDYINPTGLVAHASNYFVITLEKGSTVMATWSTVVGGEGTIAADTFVAATLTATAANLVAAAADVLKLNMTKTGTQTLPAGRLVVHGRYL